VLRVVLALLFLNTKYQQQMRMSHSLHLQNGFAQQVSLLLTILLLAEVVAVAELVVVEEEQVDLEQEQDMQ
jgi:hypothetical protein